MKSVAHEVDNTDRVTAYRARISIAPEWAKIIQERFPSLKDDKDAYAFINRIFDNEHCDANEESSLIYKNFAFTCFNDRLSGMEMTWSNFSKNFVGDMHVRGYVIDGDTSKLEKIFAFDKHRQFISIAPWEISFPNTLPDLTPTEDEVIQRFPLAKVIDFLLEIETFSGWGADNMIKTFPKQIQDLFDQYQIKYDPWNTENYGLGSSHTDKKLAESDWLNQKGVELYKQKMKGHSFKSPYMKLDIALECFRSDFVARF